MQKTINRFWNWIFHPAIRKYDNPNAKAIFFRYPSPGNCSIESMTPDKQADYKTPYEHTQYNVRYARPTPMQKAETFQTVSFAPIKMTPIKQLKKVGLLKQGDENNPDAVAGAKESFKKRYGYSVDDKVYQNESEYNVLRSTNREDMAAYIQSFYHEVKQLKEDSLDPASIKSTIHDPEIVPLESVDMFVAPHWQQGRIDNEYALEQSINQKLQKKQIDAYCGDARFWKAIDDAFDKEEITKLQEYIGDKEPTEFEIRPSKIEYEVDRQGKIVDIHPKH